jgi:hypothetical protein
MVKLRYRKGKMKNWSNTIEEFDQKSEQYQIWKLEQLINFGLDGEKIPKTLLKKYLSVLNIDEAKKRYLNLLLTK